MIINDVSIMAELRDDGQSNDVHVDDGNVGAGDADDEGDDTPDYVEASMVLRRLGGPDDL